MKASDLPGELDSDYMVLETRMAVLAQGFIRLGEEKAKIEIFAEIRNLIAEKEQSGDEIAVQVLNWFWMELSERRPDLYGSV